MRNFSKFFFLTIILVLAFFYIVPAQAQSTDFSVVPEYTERMNVEQRLQAYDTNILGDSVDLNTGLISFEHTDISLPGNSGLEVAIRRKRATGFVFPHLDEASRASIEETGQPHPEVSSPLADWSLEVPHVSILATVQTSPLGVVRAPSSWTTSICDFTRQGPSVAWRPGSNVIINNTVAPDGSPDDQAYGTPDNQADDGGLPSADVEQNSGQQPEINEMITLQDYQTTNGMDLVIPGQGSKKLIYNPGGLKWPAGTIRVTTDNWFATCIDAGNGVQGLMVTSPGGVTYKMDQFIYRYATAIPISAHSPGGSGIGIDSWSTSIARVEVVLRVSEVKDVHNNWVKYDYNPQGWVEKIHSNDGREIILNFGDNHYINSVEANDREWKYEYENLSSGTYLKTVTRPDGLNWSFDLDTLPIEANNAYDCEASDQSASLTHPMGISGTFDFSETFHIKGYLGPKTPNSESCVTNDFRRATSYDVMSLTRKTLEGEGYPSSEWNYTYSQKSSLEIPNTKWGQVENPLGEKTKTTYHNRDNVDLEGLPLKTEIFSGNTKLQTTSYLYEVEDAVGSTYLEIENPAKLTRPRHTVETVTTVTYANGSEDDYTTKLSYNTIQNSPDYSYGNPVEKAVSSNVSTRARETNIEYEHDTTAWILGLTKTISQNNRELASYEYNDLGQVISETRYGVHHAKYKYLTTDTSFNSKGNLSQVTDALDRKTQFSQWKRGTPQRIYRGVGASDGINEYQYVDDNGWMKNSKDALGRTTLYKRDKMGRLTQIDPPGSWSNTDITYNFDNGGAVQTIVTGQSKETIEYDSMLRPISEHSQALDSVWSSYVLTRYDSLGRTTFKSQPSENSAEAKGTDYTYDGLGRVLTERENFSPFALTQHEYVSRHRHRVRDAENGRVDYLSYGYGGPDNKEYRAITRFEGNTVVQQNVFVKNIWGQLTKTIQKDLLGYGNQLVQTYNYDNQQRLCRRYNPEHGYTLYQYDAAGQAIAYAKGQPNIPCGTPGGRAKVNLTYDTLGRLKSKRFSDDLTPDVEYSYDANSNLLSVKRDALNSNDDVKWTYTYEPTADLIKTEKLDVDNRNFDIAYSYNTSKHLKSKTLPSGQGINYATDGLGRFRSVKRGSAALAGNINYHSNGALANMAYGNAQAFSQTLNSRLLPLRMRSAKGGKVALDQTYGYDSVGRITSINDDATELRGITENNSRMYGYDGLGRLTFASGPWGNGSYAYDGLGNLRYKRLGTRKINLSYDSKNRLIRSLDSGDSGTRDFSYDLRGNVNSIDRVNDSGIVTRKLTYAPSTSWTHTAKFSKNGDTLMSLETVHFKSSFKPTDKTVYFSPMAPGDTQTRLFDVYIPGNNAIHIVEVTVKFSGKYKLEISHRTFAEAAALNYGVSRIHADYSKANSGYNQANDPWTTVSTASEDIRFKYDMSDQPRAVLGKAAGDYRYDGNFKRVKAKVGGETIYNVYDLSGSLVHVYNITTGKRTDYVSGPRGPLARITNNVVTYLHPNHLGSAQSGSDSAGDILWREKYTPYGEEINSPAANDNLGGFTGHIRDKATGLNYMQARYYDPVVGRFLSIDPVTFLDTGNPTYFNRYAYVGNDPINLLDPTGMIIECADSGSCTNEDGTELFNTSSITHDGDRALINGKITELSETGDFQSKVENIVNEGGSTIEVGTGARSYADPVTNNIQIGREVNSNYLVDTNEPGAENATGHKTFFGHQTHPVSIERIVVHETQHLSNGVGSSVGGAYRKDERGTIRSTNGFMSKHYGEPSRRSDLLGHRRLVRRKK